MYIIIKKTALLLTNQNGGIFSCILLIVEQSTNACEMHSSASSFGSAILSPPSLSVPPPSIFLYLSLHRTNVKTMVKETSCNHL